CHVGQPVGDDEPGPCGLNGPAPLACGQPTRQIGRAHSAEAWVGIRWRGTESGGFVKAFSTTLDASAESVPVARHFAASYMRRLGLPRVAAADAELVVSELVANAVEHGQGRVDLRLGLVGTELLVEVRDAGTGDPVPRARLTGAESGYGLWVVER